jgi:hypothetical protein
MPRRSREEKIIKAIRKYLVSAVKSENPITHERLMKVSKCARATFYRYVKKDSEIHLEIEAARAKQKKYLESVRRADNLPKDDINLRKRLEIAEEGGRELLAFIARMTANLYIYGVESEKIQRAQSDAMPHPNRSFPYVGRGRRRR